MNLKHFYLDKNFTPINDQIRAKKVRCINSENVNLGVIDTHDAMKLANKVGLDLIQISNPKNGEPPICKILDYGKYQYDLSKKQKLQDKKQRESITKVKEIRFRPSTEANDLEVKARQAAKFLLSGHKLVVCVFFKGRENAHRDHAKTKFEDFLDMVNSLDELKGLTAQPDGNVFADNRGVSASVVAHPASKKQMV